MRLTIKSLTRMLTAVLTCLAAASCGRDGVDGEVAMEYAEIVTFEGNTAPGGAAKFSFQEVDNLPVVTLTASTPLEGYEPGTRMLISYTNPSNQPYTSGPISLLDARRITQGPAVTEWDEVYEYWGLDPVWLNSIWRSGDYINMRLRLTYTAEPRFFGLVLAPNQDGAEWPLLYLAHFISVDVDYHDREYYASFDVSELRARQGVKGIRVGVNDSNMGAQVFTFPF